MSSGRSSRLRTRSRTTRSQAGHVQPQPFPASRRLPRSDRSRPRPGSASSAGTAASPAPAAGRQDRSRASHDDAAKKAGSDTSRRTPRTGWCRAPRSTVRIVSWADASSPRVRRGTRVRLARPAPCSPAASRPRGSAIFNPPRSSGPWYTVTRSSGKQLSGRRRLRLVTRGRFGYSPGTANTYAESVRVAHSASRARPSTLTAPEVVSGEAQVSWDFQVGPRSRAWPGPPGRVGTCGCRSADCGGKEHLVLTRSTSTGLRRGGALRRASPQIRSGPFVNGGIEGDDHAPGTRHPDLRSSSRRRAGPEQMKARRRRRPRAHAASAWPGARPEAQVEIGARGEEQGQGEEGEHPIREREALQVQNLTLPAVSEQRVGRVEERVVAKGQSSTSSAVAKTVQKRTETARPPTRRASCAAMRSPARSARIACCAKVPLVSLVRMPKSSRRATVASTGRRARSGAPSSSHVPRDQQGHRQRRDHEHPEVANPGLKTGSKRPAVRADGARTGGRRPGPGHHIRRAGPARIRSAGRATRGGTPSTAHASVMPWRPSCTGMATVRNDAAGPTARAPAARRGGLRRARPGHRRGRARPAPPKRAPAPSGSWCRGPDRGRSRLKSAAATRWVTASARRNGTCREEAAHQESDR